MKKFLKKPTAFLLALSLGLLIMSMPLTTYATEDEVKCDEMDGTTLDTIAGENNFVTEISEPLGGFEENITDGSNNLTEVYWKFSCLDPEGTPSNLYIAYSPGACPDEAEFCTVVQVIRGSSGTDILKTYIALIYRWAAGLVGIVAVLVIVVSGIQISIDQGSGENVTSAKNRIMQSLAGLVILFLSALILYTINPTFFTQ
ncbi:MAG: pilin [Candidatus Peregrinibacteria bacterium]|nr:pilin [Candidatus Peregrinibacteria bacterium]